MSKTRTIGVVTCGGELHTTGESHHRVIVTEVMGRDAQWIALHSGLDATGPCKLVDPGNDYVRTARAVGTTFGARA
jgi:6-phosphofructokinase